MLLSLLSKRSLDVDSRDAYGFTVRPQQLQRFREYANVYKQEEEERSNKWKSFIEQQAKCAQPNSVAEENIGPLPAEVTEQKNKPVLEVRLKGDDSSSTNLISDIQSESSIEKVVSGVKETKNREVKRWAQVRPSLNTIENMMSFRVSTRGDMEDKPITSNQSHLQSTEEVRRSEKDSKEEFEDLTDFPIEESTVKNGVPPEPYFPMKEELEVLVRGGVPRDLRGEVWQAFVGVRARRVERYYQDLLDPEGDTDSTKSHEENFRDKVEVPEKCRKQIEKDLPRTFPGHPALNEKGRDSLRRLLVAYARHNPSVGYCQAMNFFAGLLLLMMPEENAFWTLVGIIDDYFDGYFSVEMIESQVDQLVFEELVRERFPKLVNHLDYLGVQVAWFSGPWFLSIFVNMLPWESVLRVWDVLLFEGNRVMLFRTALALMELYGPAIVTTQDAGDAITLLQSLTGSTFDSSQLVMTACMGFLSINEDKLQQLRNIHRPAVLEAMEEMAAMEERDKETPVWKDSKGLATKLYSFKHDAGSLVKQASRKEGVGDNIVDGENLDSPSNLDDFLMNIDSEVDSLPDLEEQVVWLKAELCRMLEEKRSATLRAEELETAFMEMVKQDNRRELTAMVEQLEQEVADLKQVLSDKKEQENAMLQVLMRLEQEQKVAEGVRLLAEQDAVVQRHTVKVLQEKNDKAMSTIAKMEQRVVMAESTLEATLQYESGQIKALSSPRTLRPESSQETQTRRGLLSFGLGWRDRNKAKPANAPAPSETKTSEAKPPNLPSPRETKSTNVAQSDNIAGPSEPKTSDETKPANATLPSDTPANATLPSETPANATLPSETPANATLPSETPANATVPDEEAKTTQKETNGLQESEKIG